MSASRTDDDARRALGRRPGPPPPRLQLEGDPFDLPTAPAVDFSPPARTRGLSISIPLSSPTDSVTPFSPSGQKRFRRPTISRGKRPQPNEPKGLVETRKLLSHLLDRLEGREIAPDVLECANVKAKAAATTHGKERGTVGRLGQVMVAAAHSGIGIGQAGPSRSASTHVEGEDGEDLEARWTGQWDTEATCDLVDQTRGLLILAQRQGLDLFAGDQAFHTDQHLPLPGKAKKKGGRLSSFASPILKPESPQVSTLAEQLNPTRSLRRRLVDILGTLLHADGLHQAQRFRPLLPPKALQVACLDLATVLYEIPGVMIKVEIGGMVADGMRVMDPQMTDRICQWLEGRLQGLLALLHKARGGTRPGPLVSTMSQLDAMSHEISGIADLLTDVLAGLVAALHTTSGLPTVHRLHRLLSMILVSKPDSYLDLLQIVAFAPKASRNVAVSILNTYYPSSTGHNMVARRLADITYAQHRQNVEDPASTTNEDSEEHHFTPWRISSKDSIKPTNSRCLICEAEIHGFCIKCTMCTETRHLHCLRSTTEVFSYEVIRMSSPSATKTVYVKFSLSPVRMDEKLLNGTTIKGTTGSTIRQIGQHMLRLVNLFTMTACGSCQEPLWGTNHQAYACLGGCQRFHHSDCLEKLARTSEGTCRAGQHVLIDDVTGKGSDPFTVSYAVLQETSDRHLKPFLCQDTSLETKSYDEVAILYGALWTQQKILENGISGGTLIITFADKARSRSDPLGLRHYIKLYETYLAGDPSRASPAAMDFAHISGAQRPLGQGYMFSGRYLTYCAALLRSPPRAETTSRDLLDPFGQSQATADTQGAAELVDLATIKKSIGNDLGTHDDHLATILLNQLNTLGLCTISNQHRVNMEDVQKGRKRMAFTLPLLMDATPSVELLVTAIESLLDDLDLSMNEQALRLALTRAWPSLLCAPYSLERLGGAIAGWVMHEDIYLLQIVKHYASRNKPLPGVRPNSRGEKGFQGTSSVPLYKGDRGRLLTMYALPWLSALHDQDPDLYGHMIYEQSKCSRKSPSAEKLDTDGMALSIAKDALECLTAAAEANILFSTHLEVTVAWLEDMGHLAEKDTPFRPLPRFIGAGHTWDSEDAADIWTRIRNISSATATGLASACRWVRIMAVSDVEIPWEVMSYLVDLVKTSDTSLPTVQNLLVATTQNTTHLSPDRFAEICSDLLQHLVRSIVDLGTGPSAIKHEVFLQGLRMLLKAYGVPAEDVAATALGVGIEEKAATISKRKRLTLAPRQFDLSEEAVLAAATMLQFPEMVTITLESLRLLFDEATLIRNADGSLYAISEQLFKLTWSLLDTGSDRTDVMHILLRLLAVNPFPLEDIVRNDIDSDPHRSRERLLAFILSLTEVDAAHNSTNTGSASVGLIRLFFHSMADPTSQSPDYLAIVGCLLPTQLSALSTCFANFLARANDEQRLSLLCDLLRIRSILPQWPILSWAVLEELLAEQVAAVTQMNTWRKSQPMSAKSDLRDTQLLRASLVTLGLDMLAAGVAIPWPVAQKFQQHVAAACALPWPTPNDGIVNLVLPSLRRVLDSAQRLSTSGQKSILVGSLFVPVVVDFGNELRKHYHMAQRCLLDILMVTFFKQEVRTVELAALGTLQTAADFVALPGSTENRLLALQIIQTAYSRMDDHSLLRVSPSIFTVIAGAYIDQVSDDGDSAIIEHCRNVLRSLIKSFGHSGLFIQVFKIDSVNASWSHTTKSSTSRALQSLILEEAGTTIIDSIFADLAELIKRDASALHAVLDSLAGFTAMLDVEVSERAVESFGLFLNRVTKHVAEWEASQFRPDPLLVACRYVLDRADPIASVPLLHQIATVLMLSLSRFNIQSEPLSLLLKTTQRVARRETTEDTPRIVLGEALRTGLLHGDMSAATMTAVLKCILETSDLNHDIITSATSGCMAMLARQHPTFATHMDAELSLALQNQAASVLLAAEDISPGELGRQLLVYPDQAAQERCETFIHLFSAAKPTQSLASIYPVIARATSLCLRACGDYLSVSDTSGDGAEILATAFNISRLVLLGDDREAVRAFWARTWPDWQRLLTLSYEPNCVNAPLRTVSHSVFLDVVIFLATINSPLLASSSENIATSLVSLDDWLQTSGMANNKLVKARHSLTADVATSETSALDRVRSGIRADILASEKLKTLRGRP